MDWIEDGREDEDSDFEDSDGSVGKGGEDVEGSCCEDCR